MFTDHKPLTFAFLKLSYPRFSSQQYQLVSIFEYAIDNRHIPGKRICVIDAFPWLSVNSVFGCQYRFELHRNGYCPPGRRHSRLSYSHHKSSSWRISLQEIYKPCVCLMSLQVILDPSYLQLGDEEYSKWFIFNPTRRLDSCYAKVTCCKICLAWNQQWSRIMD